MSSTKMILVAIAVIASTGCASTVTSIKQTEKPDTYYLTKVNQYPFVVTGDLNVCKAQGTKMECRKLNP